MIRILVLALLLATPALAQDPARPAVGPAPIHPNDLNAGNAQSRVDELRRSGNPADHGQINALESLRTQSDNMNDAARRSGKTSSLAPIPPERREVPARPAPGAPGEWPGYRPGYLPRQ